MMDGANHAGMGGQARSRAKNIGNGSNDMINTALNATARRSSSSPSLFRTVTWILIVLCASFLSFYIGVWTGLQTCKSCSDKVDGKLNTINNLPDEELRRRVEAQARQKVKAELEHLCKEMAPSLDAPHPRPPQTKHKAGSSPLLSKSISHFVQGLVRVGKDDLMQTYDFGVPPAANSQDMDALILYNKKQALPSDEKVARAARYEDPTKPLASLSAKTATENCDTMNVVLMDNPSNTRQCFALVGGQYQSYHVQRWMRVPHGDRGAVDSTLPLILSSRAHTAAGKEEFPTPVPRHVKRHQEKLLTYLTEVDNIKSRLKTILQKMNEKTVVVLTCNHGQSELLMNFACSSRARGFDLNNVLVFPTDLETHELAEGIGLTSFYEETMMASVPKKEARVYGDGVFTSVMYAKILCVQLVNDLGYDLLFQDADVVWYKNPLDFFHNESLPKFDLYFQDDGSRQERYAPYSANTGFYYVRSNPRTQHLFRHFIYTADLVDAWNSHQQVLIALLAEHSSVTGLSVKIYAKEMEEFPGGLQYHRKTDVMKKIMKNESNAYMFHMSWTNNKDNKLKFFQQMGEWYLKDQCVGEVADAITYEKIDPSGSDNKGVLIKHCCLAEPQITCHYRDKPSKIPCPDSPHIDKNGKPFW